MSFSETNSDNKLTLRRSTRNLSNDDLLLNPTKKFKKFKDEDSPETSLTTSDKIKEAVVLVVDNSSLCETCGEPFIKRTDKRIDEKIDNKCSPCKKAVKELSNEYNDDKNKICENCKENSLSLDNRMIGCLICMKYYHVNCLLPSDLSSDLKFGKSQLIRRKLGCLRCAVIHLCYKASSIITWKWRKEAIGVSNPDKYYMPREFLIHYYNMSFWDCEWVSEAQLEISEANLYRAYKRKVLDFINPPSVDILSDSHKRKLSNAEVKLHEKYFQWGIDPEWLQPHKVLKMDDVGCFVKWRGLGYEFVSTEPLTRVNEIAGLKETINRHKKVIKELTCESWIFRDKTKLTKLSESPDYLGPTSRHSENKATLHPYQLEGVNWLRSCYSNNINTILADEMGLGKTIQAISFLYSLYKDNVSRGPFLIIVPLSTMKNWEREFEFWAPDFCIVTYYGYKETRMVIRDNDIYNDHRKRSAVTFHVLLTTYELILMDESFLSHISWEILIFDEAHRLKNNETKLFKSLKKYSINYRNLMTGTPLQNNLEELFNLLNFMEPNSFGDMSAFLSQFNDISKEEQVRTLQDMLKKHILRRLKSDVFTDLPTKEEQIVRVELTPLQKKFYKIVLAKNYEALSGKFKGIRMINIVMQLRKCCNHPYLLSSEIADDCVLEDGSYDPPALIAASGKMQIMKMMLMKLKETGHKVLIFSGMTKLLDLIEYLLEYMNIQYERIDGSVSSNSRQDAIDRFNDPDSISMVFLLSTKAGGLGINLSSADTVFIYDSDWNPQNDIQALSRAHRIGQKRKVMIYRFVTRNSIEEKVMERAKRKLMVTNLVIKSFTNVEFHQIISFGTKELFDETNENNDQKIMYDDAAIDQLLDRNRTEAANPESSFLDSCFSGFKMAQYQFASEKSENEENPVKINKIDDDVITENVADYWASILEPYIKNNNTEENTKEPELGKGFRHKKRINYNTQKPDYVNEKDPDDTDYDISEGENVDNSSSSDVMSDDSFNVADVDKKPMGDNSKHISKFNMDRDYKDLANFGISPELTNQIKCDVINENAILHYKHFSIINGFMPKERMEIYEALMNYGLPPKTLKKGDLWWPSALEHKTIDDMDKFITTFMLNLAEFHETYSNNNKNCLIKDEIDYDLLLARIGINGLINFKVNQYEGINRTILEIVTYKTWNVRTIPIDELSKLFNELSHFEMEFNIFEGGFSEIQNDWNDYDIKYKRNSESNPTLHWNKLHDYYMLSAIATHGYDKYIDQIFIDPQYQILFIPLRIANMDFVANNADIRKSFRNRQRLLENALLIEAQIMKIGAAFDGYSIESFSIERLKYYHEFFAKQADNLFITPALVNNKIKLNAMAQLELLINDIESSSDSFRPIVIKLENNESVRSNNTNNTRKDE